jgi:uracil-DNA glycosylase
MIPPGSGHPMDRATPQTPVAADAAAVARLAAAAGSLAEIDARSSVCRACPRLVAWREQVARERRAAYAAEEYWGRPITGWGGMRPRLLVSGLAPAAHGGNRTGRIFTGDRSGDWLYAALHRAGLASQPTSVHADDGLRLADGVRIVLPVRCAPPANKPTPAERDACAGWLAEELRLIAPTARCAVVLGGFGWTALGRALSRAGVEVGRLPAFGHGVEARLPGGLTLLGCYHVSQQNTFTGRLTEAMLDDVLRRAKELAGLH